MNLEIYPFKLYLHIFVYCVRVIKFPFFPIRSCRSKFQRSQIKRGQRHKCQIYLDFCRRNQSLRKHAYFVIKVMQLWILVLIYQKETQFRIFKLLLNQSFYRSFNFRSISEMIIFHFHDPIRGVQKLTFSSLIKHFEAKFLNYLVWFRFH